MYSSRLNAAQNYGDGKEWFSCSIDTSRPPQDGGRAGGRERASEIESVWRVGDKQEMSGKFNQDYRCYSLTLALRSSK